MARWFWESDFYSQFWERDDDETSAAMGQFARKESHIYRIHPKFMWDVGQEQESPYSLLQAGLEIEGLFPLVMRSALVAAHA